MDLSKLIPWSIGYANEAIREYTLWLNVVPTERIDLRVSDPNVIKENNVVTDDGVANYSSGAVIRAKWMSIGGGNRVSAPFVGIGEHVMIYRYDSTDHYFWALRYTEIQRRTTEKAMWLFSNKEKPSVDFDMDNNWMVEVDTINKRFEFNLPNTDGEEVGYNITIDLKKQLLQICDSNNNFIALNSEANTLKINTSNHIEVTSTESQQVNTVYHETNIETGQINTDKYEVSNTTTGLLAALVELTQTIIDHQGIGNCRMTVPVTPEYQDKFAVIREKFRSFI